jgi:hypothetical protein
MRASDQFHVGIVVADLDRELERLTAVAGYQWGTEVHVDTSVLLPAGEVTVDFRFRYSVDTPRLELIQQQDGTLWMPVEGSGVHHLGYWSDDIAADGAALDGAGFHREASGMDGGAVNWAYYAGEGRPRIELVSRTLQPFLELLYAGAS